MLIFYGWSHTILSFIQYDRASVFRANQACAAPIQRVSQVQWDTTAQRIATCITVKKSFLTLLFLSVLIINDPYVSRRFALAVLLDAIFGLEALVPVPRRPLLLTTLPTAPRAAQVLQNLIKCSVVLKKCISKSQVIALSSTCMRETLLSKRYLQTCSVRPFIVITH